MTTSTEAVPGYPYTLWRHGQLVSHALPGDRGVRVCDCHEDCGALVVADGPLRDWDVDVVAGPYDGRHRRAEA